MFVNVDTGERHKCGEACDAKEDRGERVVCRLTRVVLYGAVAPETRASGPKKRARLCMGVQDAVEQERSTRRRSGDMTIRRIFPTGNLPLDAYVDRANKMYEWLGEKRDFGAVLYATLICMAQGVNTPFVCVARDEALSKLLPPTRKVGEYGIPQNAVTKIVTAIKSRRSGTRMCL